MNNILIILTTIAFYISLKKEKTNLEKRKIFSYHSFNYFKNRRFHIDKH
ncbi:hypothetical protein HMPREF9386_1193 [Streptococcus sanguinis SK330]|uniref:Uncharacterized protein n=1 Tax=Streptococcus sanguinis SK330 TaxID=888813 RepID=F2C7W7_STRSA|nr:hypothetical protein HMPREF9386_1193 [Streptococcus sanguinis SK330]